MGSASTSVRVFIGDTELKGMIRTEVDDSNTGIARTLLAEWCAVSLTADAEPALRNVRLVWGPVPATAATVHVWRVGPSDTPADVRGWTNATVAPGATHRHPRL